MSKGIDLDNLNVDVLPGEDFYQFVNGGWLAKTEIPGDRSSWGSFHELAKDTDHKVLSILSEELNQQGQSANIAARVFESGMDIDQIEKKGVEAISQLLQKISGVESKEKLPALLGRVLSQEMGGLIQFSVHPDLANSRVYACYLEPGNLGLPEREYYLETDERTREIQNSYTKYITLLLSAAKVFPHNNAYQQATRILELETVLSTAMMTKEDRRDISKIYNPWTLQQLTDRFPRFDWEMFFKELDIAIPAQIIVTDTGYFDQLQSWLDATSLEDIKTYLSFILIHQAAPFANHEFEQAHFDLYARTIEGIETMKPRNERIIKIINSLLGEALGELFVSKHFPADAKQAALEMVEDIVAAYRNRIEKLQWMSGATKKYAIEKLNAVRIKIGYPGTWKNYDDLEIHSEQENSSYLHNILAAAAWKKRKDLKRIGEEVDREEWFMAPQVVNAYYNPLFNEIVFPAAILQPPFFDWQADAATNYGGIGAVIGHEITHGFDDQGSRFDKEGNFKEWWTETDRVQFEAQTRQLVKQFDEYYPFEDLSLNGTFTLGENIADLGGLSVAFDGLQLYFSRHGKPPKVDGFTAEQRFFISWATVWRTKIRPEAMRNQIKTDPHPPGQYRAVAAPSNMNCFYEAFEVQPNSPWFRKKEERIKIW